MSISAQGVKVYETIKQHLQSNEFHFDADDSKLVIKLTVTGNDLAYHHPHD